MICSKCNANNREHAKFCRGCGVTLVGALRPKGAASAAEGEQSGIERAPSAPPEQSARQTILVQTRPAVTRGVPVATAQPSSMVVPSESSSVKPARNCHHCTRPFRQTDVHCTSCGIKLKRGGLFLIITCASCATPIAPEHKFCPGCGLDARHQAFGAAQELFAEDSDLLPTFEA